MTVVQFENGPVWRELYAVRPEQCPKCFLQRADEIRRVARKLGILKKLNVELVEYIEKGYLDYAKLRAKGAA